MQLALALAVVVALAGCVGGAQGAERDAGQDPPETCPWRPSAQVAFVQVVGHDLRTPDGYSAGGRYHEFEWSGDLRDLTRIELRLEWDAQAPLTEQLMIGVPSNVSGPDHYAYGPYQGASPIQADIVLPRLEVLKRPLQVNFGASGNHTPIGGWAEPEQPAALTLQETYDPCRRRG